MIQKGVALIVPCKGNDLGLEANLRALVEQDHRNYETVFGVESEQDSAVPVMRRAARPLLHEILLPLALLEGERAPVVANSN
jgi:hypothetical protein